MDPSEVSGSSLGPVPDEVGVDVEAVIGDDGEVLSLGSVEVEHHPVSSHKPWIVAERAKSIASGFPNCRNQKDQVISVGSLIFLGNVISARTHWQAEEEVI